MAESLHLDVFNMYSGCELVCEVKAFDGNRLVHNWTSDDPRTTIHQGIDSTNDSVFDKMHMKRHLDVVFDLFEPKKIIVKGD